MKNSSRQYLYSVCRQAWQELRALATKAGGMLMRTPLPKILLLCIGLALLLTIVPLVLTLFAIFMLVKIFFLLIAINVRKQDQASSGSHWRHQDFEDVQVVRVEHIVRRNNSSN